MDELTILSHPARVRALPPGSDDALVVMLAERFAIPAESSLYLWRAEISNDLLDSHFTHMSESTLRNYAADAKAGVAFLKGHDWRALPIGYSLDAAYEDGDKKRVVADFYTVRGLSETDDLVMRMQAGILRDVSVGFHGGEMRCDLCSKGFWDCPHIPGLKYETKEGDTVRTQLATFTIEDARLSEVSGVFDGSTPGAMILKAQERASELTDSQRRILEQRYRVKLPATKRAFAGADIPTGQTPREEVDMEFAEQMQATLEKYRLGDVNGVDEGLRKLDTELARLRDIETRTKEMEAQAAEGRQYRKDLIEAALTEGVRAMGDKFDRTAWEADLQKLSLERVKSWTEMWATQATERLQGGRKSVDEGQDAPEKETPTVSHVPAHAYAA